MRRAGFLVAIGVTAYFIFLFLTLPATRLENYIEKRVQGLSLSAVSGSVFYGDAGRVRYRGVSLGSARWEFLPSALLTGRIEYFVEFSTPNGPGHANAGVTFTGAVYGHDIDLSFPPDNIIDFYSPVAVESSGSLNVLIEYFNLDDGFPPDLAGQLVWRSAAIMSPVEVVFGDTVMNVQNVGEELVGHIENEADFKLSGQVAVAAGGQYRFDLLLMPGADVSSQTLRVLESITAAQPGGKYRLRSSGQW